MTATQILLLCLPLAFVCATVLRWQHVANEFKRREEAGIKAELALLKAQLAETQRAVHKTAILTVECGRRLKISSTETDLLAKAG